MLVNTPVVFLFSIVAIFVIVIATFAVYETTRERETIDEGPPIVSRCATGAAFFDERTKSMEFMSLASMSSNIDMVTDYCIAGYDLLALECPAISTTYQGSEYFTDPKKDQRFIELCCNNDSNTCDLSSLQCLFKQSDFMYDDMSMETMDPSSWSSNKEAIIKYCDDGYMNNINGCTVPWRGTATSNIIGAYHITGCQGSTGCLVNIYGPPPAQYQNSLTYRTMCCNTLTPNTNNCNRKSVACTIDGSDFMKQSIPLHDTIHKSTGNEDLISKWCDLGKALDTNECVITKPFDVADFSYGCCNGSTGIDDCNSESRQCLFDSDKFSSKEYTISNLLSQPSAWYSNKSQFEDYCNTGKSLVTRGCIQKNPLSPGGSVFPQVCCNGSMDINSCTDGAMQCLYNTSLFADKDYFMNSTAQTYLQLDGSVSRFADNNATMTNEYCTIGKSILDNHCVYGKPMESLAFREFCCNGSTDPSKCTSTVSSCTSLGGTFLSNDVHNFPVSSIIDNASSVQSYCDIGSQLLEKNCSTNPINVSALYQGTQHTNFQDLCCAGTKDPARCNTAGYQCAINASSFSKLSYSLQNILPSQLGGSALNMITNMCNLGFGLTNNDCQNYDPKQSTPYMKYCCNNSIDGCGDLGLECTRDYSTFIETDYNMTNVVSTVDNRSWIDTTFCNPGKASLQKGCNPTLIHTSNFDRLCL